VFSLEAENKRLDALNDEYICTISEQAAVIRDLQIERHALEASCADEIRKTEEQLEFWKEQTVIHRGVIDELKRKRQDREYQELHDQKIVMGEKVKLLKELVGIYDINNPSDMYVLIKKIKEL